VAGQDELVRVVHINGQGLVVGRNLPGRGAWLCRGSPGCLERATGRNGLSRALRVQVTADMVDRLRAQLGC